MDQLLWPPQRAGSGASSGTGSDTIARVMATDDPVLHLVRRLPARGPVERSLVRVEGHPWECWVVPLAARAHWDDSIAAITAVESPHVRGVHDVAITASGELRLLVAVRTGPTLDELFADRSWPTPGRVVTALTPIAQTIREAHARGVTLGAPGIAQIGVDASGAPVIDVVDGARVGAPLPVELRPRDPAHRADDAAFAALWRDAQEALVRAGHADVAASLPDPESVLERPETLVRWAEPQPLFAAAPAAVSTTPPVATAATASQALDHGVERVSAPQPLAGDVAQPGTGKSIVARVLAMLAVPATIHDTVHAGEQALRDGRARVVARASAASRRQVIGAALGLSVVLTIVVGSMVSGDPSASHSSASSSPASGDSESMEAEESGGAQNSGTAAPSAADDPLGDAEPAEWLPVVAELLRRWEQCRSEVRVLCDEALHAEGAASGRAPHEQDALVSTLAQTTAASGAVATIVERSGDVVLIDVTAPETTPASLLIIRSEAGWRLRDAWS